MISWPIDVSNDKYFLWYNNLVSNAQNRPLIDGYVERHHIVPVSLGGSNDPTNIVTLTAREHYIAHLLLWKMKMTAKMHNQMTMALHVMVNGSGNKKQNRSYLVSSRIYESSRKAYSELLSIERQGEGNSFYGKTHTPESIEKMKAWQRDPLVKQQQRDRVSGKNNPMYGKKHSDDMKGKIANSVSMSWTEEKKLEKSAWAKERWQDPEYRKMILEARKAGKQRDWKANGRKAAETKKANGWRPSEESKRKISETRKAKIAAGEIVLWNKGKSKSRVVN